MKKLFLLLALALAGMLTAGNTPPVAQATPLLDLATPDLILYSQKYATNEHVLNPGPYDAGIARLTAEVLEHTHYTRHPLDDTMSERFLHRYLELLDGQHLHFVQSDLDDFDGYRTTLDDLTLTRGDTSPANEIFARFLLRVAEHVEYVGELLRTETFDFTGQDRFTPNRKDLDWPQDLAEAKALWREELRFEYLQEKLNKQKPAEILKTLSTRYRRLLKTLAEYDTDDILQYYLTALAQSYDPHSDYMGKAQLENFAISMKLSLFGIGAQLQKEDDYCKIYDLVPGGPAAKSKQLKPNDKIIAVQQEGQEPVDIVGWKLNKIVEIIRGPKGTGVTLTVIPADAADPSARKTVRLIRDEITLKDQAAKARLIQTLGPAGKPERVGVIDLPSFYASFDLAESKSKAEPRSTTTDVTRLLKKLVAEKVAGVILDLRHNGGGSLEEAIKLTGIFIKQGPVVQVRDANGSVVVEEDTDPGVVYDGPLIVGDKCTHGKGTVQTIYELAHFMGRSVPPSVNPGALKVTIRKFYRTSGSSTQLKGVTPDIVLPSVNNYLDVGEASLEYALAWDTIRGAKIDALDRVRPSLPELRSRTEARQAQSKDFAYVREDIERFKKLLADKSVSLNEAARLKERQESEARLKARVQERAARGGPQDTIYDISLDQVDLPGLPAPLASTGKATNGVPTQATASSGGPATTAATNAPSLQAQAAHPVPPAMSTAGANTNSSAATSATALAADHAAADDSDTEDKTPTYDVGFEETKRILLDLIALGGLTPKPPSVTVNN